MTLVALATEDELSEAVGKRLLIDAGYNLSPSPFLRRNGFGYLRSKMDSWCEMANRKPVVLLTDLDNTVCPAELRENWLGTRKTPKNLIIRVAVREIESWLLMTMTHLEPLWDIAVRYHPIQTCFLTQSNFCFD